MSLHESAHSIEPFTLVSRANIQQDKLMTLKVITQDNNILGTHYCTNYRLLHNIHSHLYIESLSFVFGKAAVRQYHSFGNI